MGPTCQIRIYLFSFFPFLPSVLHFFSCATEYQHLYSPLLNSWARHVGRETTSSLATTHELADDSPESRRCGEGGNHVIGRAHEVVAVVAGACVERGGHEDSPESRARRMGSEATLSQTMVREVVVTSHQHRCRE
jgi:hypothetical protein